MILGRIYVMIVRKKLRYKLINKFYVVVIGLLTLPYYSASEAIFYSSDNTRTDIHTILYNAQVVEKTEVGLFSSLTSFSFAPFNLNIFYRHFADLEQRNFSNFKEQIYIKVFTWDCGALFGGTCFINCDQKKEFYRQCRRGNNDISIFFNNMMNNLHQRINREKAKEQNLNKRVEEIRGQYDSWKYQLDLCDAVHLEIFQLLEIFSEFFKKGKELQNISEMLSIMGSSQDYLNFLEQIEFVKETLGSTEDHLLIGEFLDTLENLYINEIIPNISSFMYDFFNSYDDFDNTDIENLIKTLLDSILHLISVSRENIISSLNQVEYDLHKAVEALSKQKTRTQTISELIPRNIRYSIIQTEEAISEHDQIQKVEKRREVNHRTYRYHSRDFLEP